MKIAIEIPVKARSSERVPNKNFRELAGKPLCFWLIDELLASCPDEWDIYVDSEGETTFDFIKSHNRSGVRFFNRDPWFAGDNANGNHMLYHFASNYPGYDVYVQAYVTAVTLTGEVFCSAVNRFLECIDAYDSMFLITEETGWFWYDGRPLNYDPARPAGLPRSQDAVLQKETTGLYAITREALFKTGCRVGEKPLLYEVDRKYAMDIDTLEDFHEAEEILQR